MIYFIHDPKTDQVKIGYSDNPDRRLKQFQTANGSPLVMLAVIPGLITEERRLHDQFSEYREKGEWFRYEGSLEVYIDSLFDIDIDKIASFNFGDCSDSYI